MCVRFYWVQMWLNIYAHLFFVITLILAGIHHNNTMYHLYVNIVLLLLMLLYEIWWQCKKKNTHTQTQKYIDNHTDYSCFIFCSVYQLVVTAHIYVCCSTNIFWAKKGWRLSYNKYQHLPQKPASSYLSNAITLALTLLSIGECDPLTYTVKCQTIYMFVYCFRLFFLFGFIGHLKKYAHSAIFAASIFFLLSLNICLNVSTICLFVCLLVFL